MKKCSTCKEEKSKTEFYKDKTRPDGHSYVCKACNAPLAFCYYRKNKEKIQARFRANYCPKKQKAKRERYRKNEVYKLTFPNGSYYIGQSQWGASRRLGWHFKDSLRADKTGRCGNPHIHKMIQDGLKREDILVEILKTFPKGQESEMKNFETLLIEQNLNDSKCLNMRIIR